MGFSLGAAVAGFADNRSAHLKEKRKNIQRMIEKQYDNHAEDLRAKRQERDKKLEAQRSIRGRLTAMGVNEEHQKHIIASGLMSAQKTLENLESHINRHNDDDNWDINSLFKKTQPNTASWDQIEGSTIGRIEHSFDDSRKPKGGLLNYMFGSANADTRERGDIKTVIDPSVATPGFRISNYDAWLKQQDTESDINYKNAKTQAEGAPSQSEVSFYFNQMDKKLASGMGGTLIQKGDGWEVQYKSDQERMSAYVKQVGTKLNNAQLSLARNTGLPLNVASEKVWDIYKKGGPEAQLLIGDIKYIPLKQDVSLKSNSSSAPTTNSNQSSTPTTNPYKGKTKAELQAMLNAAKRAVAINAKSRQQADIDGIIKALNELQK